MNFKMQTQNAIAEAIDEFQQLHRMLGATTDVRVNGAMCDQDGGIVLSVFDTEYGQHLIVTLTADGTLSIAPAYTPNNKENKS